MGAWGVHNFENDPAMDWVHDLEENASLSFLEEMFESVLEEDYTEVDEASAVLAAAEMLAAAQGRPSKDFPEMADKLLFKLKGASFSNVKSLGKKAVEKVRESSELQELWEEADEYETWLQVVDDLLTRME